MNDKPQTLAEQINDYLSTEKHDGKHRVIDVAYSAFMYGASKRNSEDGGPCDWFNDTRPFIVGRIDAIRAALAAAALEPDPTPALGWRAMQTAAAEKIKANPAPCRPASGWTDNSNEWYELGQIDAAASFEHAILAMTGPTDEQALAEAVKLLSRNALMVENIDAVADACRAFKIRPELFRAALAKIGGAA